MKKILIFFRNMSYGIVVLIIKAFLFWLYLIEWVIIGILWFIYAIVYIFEGLLHEDFEEPEGIVSLYSEIRDLQQMQWKNITRKIKYDE